MPQVTGHEEKGNDIVVSFDDKSEYTIPKSAVKADTPWTEIGEIALKSGKQTKAPFKG